MANQSKRIVLTGASKGLGLALAHQFVKGGHSVQGCSRSSIEEPAPGFTLSCVDVTNRQQVSDWSRKLISDGYIPDILITNAGLINEPASLWDITGKEFEAIIATNVLGTSNVLQALLPSMIAKGSGMIVTLSSGWGRVTDPGFSPYCASKFAVEGLTLSLAQELPPGMGALTLSPGIVRTDMLFRCWGDRALDYELPETWAKRAAPFILGLTDAQNGSQLTVPAV